jgi:predicted nucleic acid-binding protein
VDTGYWIAALNPRDGLHARSKEVAQQLGSCTLVTSEMVLVEVLNSLAGKGEHLRKAAIVTVREIINDASIDVVAQTRRLFNDAVRLYSEREDQDWSLTDCASFVIMGERGIREALTYDQHFVQNGYRALLRAD